MSFVRFGYPRIYINAGVLLAALLRMVAWGAGMAPDAAELDAAREGARSLLVDDFKDLNLGRRTLVDVADHVADLASASNSAAMARVLEEGAFNLYKEAGALIRAAERRVPFWINLGTDAEFKFEACPAGSFMMGYEGDRMSPNFRHRVNLPRPFWIARYQTTKRLYSTFRRVNYMSDEEILYGGMDTPHGGISRKDMDDFCAFLTYRNRNRLPKGYVFRLPTDAEWEYALNAKCSDPQDPYVRFKNGDRSVAEEITVSWESVDKLRAAHGLAPIKRNAAGEGAIFAVGTRHPNAWGIYDMLGNGQEYVLDTIPEGDIQRPGGEGTLGSAYDMGYADEETEPLRWFDGPGKFLDLTRGGKRYYRFNAKWYERVVVGPGKHRNGNFTFRVALAPDILGERGKELPK